MKCLFNRLEGETEHGKSVKRFNLRVRAQIYCNLTDVFKMHDLSINWLQARVREALNNKEDTNPHRFNIIRHREICGNW